MPAPKALPFVPTLGGAILGVLSLLVTRPSSATPHPLPFSYPHATLPAGKLEVEEYVDLVPVRVARELPGSTESVLTLRSELVTELEFGITDALELGWYFAFSQNAAADAPSLRFEGLKQRLRYRFAEEGDWPVDVGAYLEVAELYDEIEIEEKILLNRRFGLLTLTTNLWLEQEYQFQSGEWQHVYHPTAGISVEASPTVSPGVEYWVRGILGGDDTAEPAHHYLGPTLLLQSGEYSLSLGAYARIDDFGDATVAGDSWGKLWLRALISVGL